jgi:8-oxo-dGTP diphosphatase
MKPVQVAVGVILDSDHRILITRRAKNAHQGDLWEFPGGKVEHSESVQQALARELHEELSIGVKQSEPLLQVRHDYGDKTVLLDVWLVFNFTGEARGVEGQPLAWATISELGDYPFPAANKPIVDAIRALKKFETHQP